MDDAEKELRLVLEKHAIPQPSSNLAERIIDAAVSEMKPEIAKNIKRPWWKNFNNNFLVPQPALVLAFVLVLGIVLGFQGEEVLNDREELSLNDFVFTASDIGEGDFL